MNLDSKQIRQVLIDKGVNSLFHANTVATSATSIKQGALLSRAKVENEGLFQTEQKSDEEDKQFDVWDCVFMDGLDLHKKYSRANKYGPILFEMDLDLLTSPMLPVVRVTKRNPWYWNDKMVDSDRYYLNIEEFENDYLTGKKLDSQIMFIFPKPDFRIKLSSFLKKIIVDSPNLLVNRDRIGDLVVQYLSDMLIQNHLGHKQVLERSHGRYKFCSCYANYNWLNLKDQSELRKRFARLEILSQ